MDNTKKEKAKVQEKVMTQLNSDPSIDGAEAEQEFFAVNFKTYLIKTDEPVNLPIHVARVVQNKNKARAEARKFARKMKFKDSTPPA